MLSPDSGSPEEPIWRRLDSAGAGGGGYLILVSEVPIENAVRVIARREND